MTPARQNEPSDEDHVSPDLDDPVLKALRQVEARYRETYTALQERSTTVLEQLEQARNEQDRLRDEQGALSRELSVERLRAERHREEATAYATALKEIHRSMFSSNVYDLVLKACLTLTGATRGVYLTTDDQGNRVEVRAAIDVNGYPSSPPSKLMSAFARAALNQEGVLAYDDAASLPEEPPDGERFRNCLVAPVVLRNVLSGVTIVADKAGGDFDESDADVLLSVGSQGAVAIENHRLQREVQEAYLSIVTILAETMAARTRLARPDR